jgi:hypothetical protein
MEAERQSRTRRRGDAQGIGGMTAEKARTGHRWVEIVALRGGDGCRSAVAIGAAWATEYARCVLSVKAGSAGSAQAYVNNVWSTRRRHSPTKAWTARDWPCPG